MNFYCNNFIVNCWGSSDFEQRSFFSQFQEKLPIPKTPQNTRCCGFMCPHTTIYSVLYVIRENLTFHAIGSILAP